MCLSEKKKKMSRRVSVESTSIYPIRVTHSLSLFLFPSHNHLETSLEASDMILLDA